MVCWNSWANERTQSKHFKDSDSHPWLGIVCKGDWNKRTNYRHKPVHLIHTVAYLFSCLIYLLIYPFWGGGGCVFILLSLLQGKCVFYVLFLQLKLPFWFETVSLYIYYRSFYFRSKDYSCQNIIQRYFSVVRVIRLIPIALITYDFFL